MDYLCANFSLPRPLCSRLRSNVHYLTLSRTAAASSVFNTVHFRMHMHVDVVTGMNILKTQQAR